MPTYNEEMKELQDRLDEIEANRPEVLIRKKMDALREKEKERKIKELEKEISRLQKRVKPLNKEIMKYRAKTEKLLKDVNVDLPRKQATMNTNLAVTMREIAAKEDEIATLRGISGKRDHDFTPGKGWLPSDNVVGEVKGKKGRKVNRITGMINSEKLDQDDQADDEIGI